MPQKRRRRPRRRSPREGSSRRLRGEDGASLSGSLVESDGSSSSSSPSSGSPSLDDPSDTRSSRRYESRYHEILASRLAQLPLPACADDDGPDLPSDETVEALVRSSFYDDELRAALVEYQAHNFFLGGPDVQGRDGDSGEFDSSSVIHDVTQEDLLADNERLRSHIHDEIDTESQLDLEELDRLYHKYARYRLKACMLLKGMPIDDAALECKYTPELALDYLSDGAFGWCFDLDPCLPASFSDYQRLVPCNEGGDEYESWSEYREFYSTPETDRDYLLYWETIVKDLKWIEEHVLKAFSEWHELHEKASCQAVRIAARFTSIHPRLAYYGFLEYKQSTRFYLKFVKDLDSVFFEIWKLVNLQMSFRDAMEHVYEENPFSLRKRDLERELSRPGSLRLEEQFRRCTEGISKEVPEWIARELISQEVRFKCAVPKTYAQYARKKLKIAEVIGLIPEAKIPT
ncbi:hypothetical protein CFC21_044777 [Triticum aestivum]|uniref:Uncharacterized protein n=2 Tax=Triticum aestivum TaxID=4565 RepID=A0A9R1FSJ4_WHEAT|nr:uncharacterized protein LOC123072720 [Triticum aestivum]KAF7033691.1 hypothetical protein CFC21_044777 [Triticum aestivum]CDM86947.1 unnamed protein product [Triticum aestivum]